MRIAAAGDLDAGDICNPPQKLLRRVTVLDGDVKAIDLAARRVTIPSTSPCRILRR